MTSATGPVKHSLEYVLEDPTQITKRAKKAYKHHAPEITNLINKMQLSKDFSYNKEDHTFSSNGTVISLNDKISLKTQIKDRFKLLFSSEVDKKIAKIISALDQGNVAVVNIEVLYPDQMKAEVAEYLMMKKNEQLEPLRQNYEIKTAELNVLKTGKSQLNTQLKASRAERESLLSEISASTRQAAALGMIASSQEEIDSDIADHAELTAVCDIIASNILWLSAQEEQRKEAICAKLNITPDALKAPDSRNTVLGQLLENIYKKTDYLQMNAFILGKSSRLATVRSEIVNHTNSKAGLELLITDKKAEIAVLRSDIQNREKDIADTRVRLGLNLPA